MKTEHTSQEIKWKTINEYIDIETGEIITKEEAIKAYIIINKKIKRHVQRTTGITTITNECRRSKYRSQELPFATNHI